MLSVSAAVSAQQPSPSPTVYVRPDKNERAVHYFKSMFGPQALAKRIAGAGISTWRNSPREWGGQWEGFGKRFASRTGTSVISNTTRFGLEEAFKLDSRYFRSRGGVGAKIKNAVTGPFVARNEHGKKVFGFPRLVGTYTGNIIAAETWYPARYSWKDGARGGTISIGTSVLFNLFKEFVHKK